MFLFKAGIFLEELQKYSPAIYEAFNNASKDELIRIKHDDIPEDSIDYAVMEKVVPSDIAWSDELPKDENGNTQNPNHISIDSKNNLIYGCERKIATVDIEDCIIGSSQNSKSELHLTGHRPWGTYTVLQGIKSNE